MKGSPSSSETYVFQLTLSTSGTDSRICLSEEDSEEDSWLSCQI